jgi:hypothetical protein
MKLESAKASVAMVVVPLPMVTEVKDEQDANALDWIVVTTSGMVTEMRESQSKNAWSPITPVGCPPSEEGIVISPPGPVYFVIIATPAFMV